MLEAAVFRVIGAALLLGLASAWHCAAMCGPIALVASRKGTYQFWLYGLGKTITYVLLGVLVATLSLPLGTHPIGKMALAVLVGLIWVATGIETGGWYRAGSWFSGSAGTFGRWLALVRTSRWGRSTLVLGLLNGLLPCGLLYAALGMATTYQSLPLAAAFMGTFGAATLPSLAAVAYLHRRFSLAKAPWLRTVLGLTMIAIGLSMMLRPWLMTAHPH